jgi:hypothetical protein
LRKTYGPTCENGSWRVKMDLEIYNEFKLLDIITVITVHRLEWLRHVRMDGDRAVMKQLEGKPGGGSN